MPSINYSPLDFDIILGSVIIPVYYNGNYNLVVLKLRNVSSSSSAKKQISGCIWNIKSDNVVELTGFYDSDKPTNFRLVDYNIKNSKLVARVIYAGTDVTEWVLSEVEVDLSALTGTLTRLNVIDTSVDSDISMLEKSMCISPRLFLGATPNKPYIWYIDPKDFSIVSKIDTGFNEYNPRISLKYIVKPDDLYILIGRHLDSANFYAWKLYGQTAIEISNSNPNSSPQPQLGNPYISEKEIYFTGSSVHVISRNNLISWFDTDFNLLGQTDLSAIYSTPYPMGFNIIGKNNAGNFLVVTCLLNAHLDNVTGSKIVLLEISSDDYSLVNYTVLETFNDMDNCIQILQLPYAYGDGLNLPLIDKRTKKLYCFGHGKDNGLRSSYKVQIDLSDIDISEWNLYNYYIPSLKKPSYLTLNIKPL